MPFRVGFLLYPHLTQLDLTGPAQVLAAMSDSALHYVWKTTEPVPSDAGISLLPTDTFDSCPALDMLLVPGGPGQQGLMRDADVLAWLQRQGAQAGWVTSVCSGSLLLGAAGLLKGYRAACHWAYRDYLPAFGANIDERRVVVDRNRITGGGVTAGIDLALWLVALVRGEDEAKSIQLQLEYAPHPPFNCGRPELAGTALIAQAKQRLAASIASLRGGA